MIRCVKCNEVSGIIKAGMVRQKQRYFCNHCSIYFSLDPGSDEHSTRPLIPTIKDIAKALGFSPSTVSKALHDHIDISEEKKALVLAKAAELDYRPNLIAASLRRQKTMTIGVVVPEFTHAYYPNILLETNRLANSAGYTLIITQSSNDPAFEIKNLNTLLANKVDGIIASVIFETKDFSHFQKMIDHQVPLVLFSRYPADLSCPRIKVDDFKGAYTAVQHLIDKGYKKIGYIGGPEHVTLCRERYEGYLAAMESNQLTTKKNWIIQETDVIPNAHMYAAQLLKQADRPDAIFAFSDPVAIAVVETARETDIPIPGEIGLIGFTEDPVSKYITPGITTMRQPFDIIAHKIMEAMFDLIKHGYTNHNCREQLLDALLVERESSNKGGS